MPILPWQSPDRACASTRESSPTFTSSWWAPPETQPVVRQSSRRHFPVLDGADGASRESATRGGRIDPHEPQSGRRHFAAPRSQSPFELCRQPCMEFQTRFRPWEGSGEVSVSGSTRSLQLPTDAILRGGGTTVAVGGATFVEGVVSEGGQRSGSEAPHRVSCLFPDVPTHDAELAVIPSLAEGLRHDPPERPSRRAESRHSLHMSDTPVPWAIEDKSTTGAETDRARHPSHSRIFTSRKNTSSGFLEPAHETDSRTSLGRSRPLPSRSDCAPWEHELPTSKLTQTLNTGVTDLGKGLTREDSTECLRQALGGSRKGRSSAGAIRAFERGAPPFAVESGNLAASLVTPRRHHTISAASDRRIGDCTRSRRKRSSVSPDWSASTTSSRYTVCSSADRGEQAEDDALRQVLHGARDRSPEKNPWALRAATLVQQRHEATGVSPRPRADTVRNFRGGRPHFAHTKNPRVRPCVRETYFDTNAVVQLECAHSPDSKKDQAGRGLHETASPSVMKDTGLPRGSRLSFGRRGSTSSTISTLSQVSDSSGSTVWGRVKHGNVDDCSMKDCADRISALRNELYLLQGKRAITQQAISKTAKQVKAAGNATNRSNSM